jgi:hypothetical protein
MSYAERNCCYATPGLTTHILRLILVILFLVVLYVRSEFTLQPERCILCKLGVRLTHVKRSIRLCIVDIKVSLNVDHIFNNL